MEKYKNFYSSPSISIIFIPYFLIYFYNKFYLENFILIGLILLIDKFLYKNLKYYFKIVILLLINISFYCLTFYYDSFHVIHELRLRYFFILYLLIVTILYFLLYRKKNLIEFHNVFFIALSFTYVFRFSIELYNDLDFSKKEFLERIGFNYKDIDFHYSKSDLPIVLIVLDEYANSSEVFEYSENIIDKKFDNNLLKMGYTIKTKFKSETQRTTFSLPSIFNFNLHNNKVDSIQDLDVDFKRIKGFDDLLKDNMLVDSLNNKSVKSYSYGLMSFKNGEKLDSDFYHWWDDQNPDSNFLSDFFRFSIFYFIQDEFSRKNTFIDVFRKDGINSLENIHFQERSFYYFHLYFPHDPYSYYDEYPYVDLNYPLISQEKYTNEYIKFRRWFLYKFEKILKNEKFENVRLIIVGDHGFRHHEKFDPYLTSGYFKGFNKKNISKIKTVQDLGYLINASF